MLSNDPVIQKATFDLYDTGNLLQDCPVKTDPVLRQDDIRFINNLPGDNWVPLGADPVVVKGKPTPFSHNLYLVRNMIQIDSMLFHDKNLYEDPIDLMWRAWMHNFTWDFNTKFFYNNQVGGQTGAFDLNDPNSFNGISTRLDNAAQYSIPTQLKIDGGGVAMTNGLTSSSTGQFEELIEQAFYYLGADMTGTGCSLYMPGILWRRWNRGTKLQGAGGGFDMTRDAFDRRVMTYQDAKVRYPGRRTDQQTEILTNYESATGAQGTSYGSSNTFASVYVVRWAADHTCGWQPKPLKPTAPVLNPISQVNYNSVIDWGYGLMPRSIYSFARIYDINT